MYQKVPHNHDPSIFKNRENGTLLKKKKNYKKILTKIINFDRFKLVSSVTFESSIGSSTSKDPKSIDWKD